MSKDQIIEVLVREVADLRRRFEALDTAANGAPPSVVADGVEYVRWSLLGGGMDYEVEHRLRQYYGFLVSGPKARPGP